MPIAFGDTPITSVSRGANAIASAALERLGFPGQTASVFSAISPPDAPTNVAITVEEDYAAPSQVTGLAVDSTGDGTIDLSWSAPASEAAITDYRIEYTPSGGSAVEVLVGSSATSYQLTGLTNDTEYSVRVAAISAGGQGDYSAAVTGTPSAAPPVLEVTVEFPSAYPIADSLVRFPSVSGNATTIRVTAESGDASGSDTFGLSEASKFLSLGLPSSSTARWTSSDGFIRFETTNRPASYSAYFTFESLDANGVVLESVSNVLVQWKDVYDDG